MCTLIAEMTLANPDLRLSARGALDEFFGDGSSTDETLSLDTGSDHTNESSDAE